MIVAPNILIWIAVAYLLFGFFEGMAFVIEIKNASHAGFKEFILCAEDRRTKQKAWDIRLGNIGTIISFLVHNTLFWIKYV